MKSQEWSLDLIRTTRQRMVGQNQFTLKAPSPPPRCPHLRKNRSRAKLEQCDHKASKFNKIISVNLRWQRGYLCHHQREPKRVSGCKHMWWCFSSQKRSISESLVYIGHFVAGCAMMDHVTDRRSRWRLPGMIDQESTHAGEKIFTHDLCG